MSEQHHGPEDTSTPLPAHVNVRDDEPVPRAVTLRSVLVGLLGVLLLCGLSPYNDFAMSNTMLVGNFLPIGFVLVILTIVFVVNAPLYRFAPRLALREGELAVIAAMILSACAVPSSGLMRYLPSSIVGLYSAATDNPQYAGYITAAHVPTWLLPVSEGTTPAEIGNSDVFKYFRERSPTGEVPWSAWFRPMLTWGALIGMIYGLLMMLSLIVRRQWAENERLAFPLATVYGSLIEAPERGRYLNALFRSPRFWIAGGAVFAVHALGALNAYDPRFPAIPLGYNFGQMLADEPWRYVTYGMKSAAIYFSMIGVAYFLQSKVAFSLWFFFVLMQGAHIVIESSGGAFTDQMKHDQTFGGLLVMAGVIIYIGRAHWWMVLRHMFNQSRPDETESRYLPYGFTGWMAVLFFAGVIGWFMCAGVTFVGALVITLALTLMLMMVARVLAETGLIFVQINWLMYRSWYYGLTIPAEPIRTTDTSFFFIGWMTAMFHDVRESFAGFFQQGLRVADTVAYERSRRWRTGAPLIGAVALALIVAYFVSFGSMLMTEYRYGTSLDSNPSTPINGYAFTNAPRNNVLDPSAIYKAGNPRESHSSTVHIAIGGIVVGVSSALRLTLSWWPLHPIAFIVLYSYATQKAWFSLMLGWVCKVIIVRLGGASLMKAAKPVFIGLIVGEAFAAAFWLVVNLAVNYAGLEYRMVNLLPG